MSTPAADNSLPLHVLTGFLGSGKTTLLNRLLQGEALADSAVIVNEFGAVGIDHLLVEHSEDNLVELAGGCVCCTVRGDLARTVLDLLARRAQGRCSPFSRIIVETTGLADPTPIGNLLVTDPALGESVHLAGIVTTVDAVNGPATLDAHANAVRQVALADQIVVTKSDLAEAEPQGLRERVARINPNARMTVAAHGALPMGFAPFSATAARPDAHDHGDAPHHHHADGIRSFIVERSEPMPGAALALFIEVLAEHTGAALLRLKGLVHIDESPDRPALLQGAQHVFQELDFLDAWPDGKARTQLVFITQGISREWVQELLDVLIWETRDIGARMGQGA